MARFVGRTLTAILMAETSAVAHTDWHEVLSALPLAVQQIRDATNAYISAIEEWCMAFEDHELALDDPVQPGQALGAAHGPALSVSRCHSPRGRPGYPVVGGVFCGACPEQHRAPRPGMRLETLTTPGGLERPPLALLQASRVPLACPAHAGSLSLGCGPIRLKGA